MTNISAILYLIASVCFILALKGLSSPKSARRGNILGILGMALAIITTIFQPIVSSYMIVIAGIIIGGTIGGIIAVKIKMTAMPNADTAEENESCISLV